MRIFNFKKQIPLNYYIFIQLFRKCIIPNLLVHSKKRRREKMKKFSEFVKMKQQELKENLVLKKRYTPNKKLVFVVDSDLAAREAGYETFKNKEKIKSLGFRWDKEINKWVSVQQYEPEELIVALPQIKQKLNQLNKNFNPPLPEESDVEEHTDLGVSEKLKERFQELKKKVLESRGSEEINQFLNFRKKFTHRSFNNQMLIWIQKPNATHVEGKNTWKEEFGRMLKLGSTAIKIYVPIKYKAKNGEEDAPIKDTNADETKLAGFTLGNIYDISDTVPIVGKEYMYVPTPKWYDEETPDESTRYIYDALLDFAKEKNIEVTVSAKGLDGARGVSRKGSIQLLQENIGVMIHELTHEILHTAEKRTGLAKKILELQADGVNYFVLGHYGLPNAHSVVYMTLWEIDPDNIRENEEIILETTRMFIEYIDKKTMEVKSEEEPKAESFKSFLLKNY